ncbi:hypothetical protein VSS37_13640 [Candidatus Thiothrix sp. Deng01]|uniref:Kazal-like domain-containing protein n=1 Tax=Candidatus Thiothrix phosphatis TaxID=3112415 RepID=A0ABU6CYX5_9GAMM|nr:hypothetical protein [Candidatus Thiothrix sp. Deng01]MEB4592031.1 hypothetical protein [Candidatus Thiothrix sp. Deng01]
MKMSGMLLLGGMLLTVFLAGFNQLDARERVVNTATFQQCREPRPEICYEVFAPVCATLQDPAIRCITAPCPSNQQATYVNDCKACADPRVQGFVGGQCP